jgi:hypothetical protein
MEMLPGALPQPGAIRAVVGHEELQEPDGFPPVKLRLLHRERRGHLLLVGKRGDSLGHGDGEEWIGEEAGGGGGEPLQDVEPFLHPGLLLPQAAEECMDGEVLLAVEVVEEVELLPEGSAPGGVIEAESLEFGLGSGPCLLDDPSRLLSPGLQGEEPLEAVDEEEPAPLVDDHQGVVGVGVVGDRPGPEDLRGDVGEWDFADGHVRPPVLAAAGGRERTWKVG